MLKAIQTYLMVTLIAVLIWVLAEGESVRVQPRTVEVQIRPDRDAARVFLVDPAQKFDGTVSVRLEGSTSSFDAIANDLRGPIVLTPDLLSLPAGTGKFAVDLRTALRAHPIFAERAVTPLETTPQSVTLDADEMVSRRVRVVVGPPEGVLLQGVPEASPAEIILRLPTRLASRLPEDAAVTAVVDPAIISQLPRGRSQTISGVRLEFPQAIRSDPMGTFVRADPPTASVSLTVQSGTDTIRLSRVPVALRIAPPDLERLDVQIPQEERDISDVIVSGPRDLIAQIGEEKVRVFAVIAPDWQQLEAAALSGEPTAFDAVFVLSTESGAPLRFEAPDRSVRVTVRRRAAGPPAPGG